MAPRAWLALGIGLAAFPLAKLLWIPNYVFNFLTTLVHECGHALFAWLMGRVSIPTVSIAGGGVTVWGERHLALCAAIEIGLGFLAWRYRKIPLFAAAVVYPLLALFANEIVVVAGGILLEIGGAVACFVVVLAVDLRRPFERPIYALWGWWMLLNRAWETILMLRSPAHWVRQKVIDSGLAAGLTSDLERFRAALGVSHETVLWGVLALCVAALPAAFGLAFKWRKTCESPG
jgi:hypothetical protein